MDCADLNSSDPSSSLGPTRRIPGHVAAFLHWADERDLATIGRELLHLVVDLEEPLLLGGVLRFLTYRETSTILAAWEEDQPSLRDLVRLSDALRLQFPEISVPRTSERITNVIRVPGEPRYFGLQFGTRRLPNGTSAERFAIAALRVWILIKALEYGRTGAYMDKSLSDLCTQVRMAVDAKGDAAKLIWFLGRCRFASSRSAFEDGLRTGIEQAPNDVAGADAVKTALRAAFQDVKRPMPSGWESLLRAADELIGQRPAAASCLAGTARLDEEFEPTHLETGGEDGDTTIHLAARGRGLVLQTQEDQQYLQYSWNQPRPDELKLLLSTAEPLLTSKDLERRVLAAIIIICVVCRRSMDTVGSMELGAAVADDWRLDVQAGRLHRLPPRRVPRWKAPPEALGWIRALAHEWDVGLRADIRGALIEAYRTAPRASCIGELWRGKNSLESTFNAWCAGVPGLERIRSGLLPRTADQVAFNATADAVFARMMNSSGNSGIPGAGAYPSWIISDVAEVFDQLAPGLAWMRRTAADSNGLGSELDPDDEQLASMFSQAREKIERLSSAKGDLTEFHNLLTAYVVVGLFAWTGARPVESVFEKLCNFDLRTLRLYLEDKVFETLGAGRTGRVVPLPSDALQLLERVYLPHLRWLSAMLSAKVPQLALEIKLQLDGDAGARIPLFFFLASAPEFDWNPVSEASLNAVGMFECPLPWNLFRHRLSVRLKTLRLSWELRDAQLGHTEAGSETYGELSTRCWDDDSGVWRQALEAAARPLGLDILPAIQADLAMTLTADVAPEYVPFIPDELFGAAARAKRRRESEKRARSGAGKEISAFIGNRPISDITSAEWDSLGRQMLFQSNNLPQPHATVRYEEYESFLSDKWLRDGIRPRVARWWASRKPGLPFFDRDCVAAPRKVEAVAAAVDHILQRTPLSKLGRANCAILAAADFAVTARIADPNVLLAVANSSKDHVRLVRLQNACYLEYAELGVSRNDAALRRFVVPYRSAMLLDRALAAGKLLASPSPEFVAVLADAEEEQARRSPEVVIRALAKHVERENSFLFPGLVAGVLSGRTKTYALGWHEWVRTVTGVARETHACENTQIADKPSPLVAPRGVRPTGQDVLRGNARAFIKQLRAAVDALLNSGQAPDKKNAARDAAVSEVRRITRTHGAEVAVAIEALGWWVLQLLKGRAGRKLLHANSINRYLDALAPSFVTFAAEVDLGDLDDDEITHLYGQMIESALFKESEKDAEGQEEEVGSARRVENTKYVLSRLREFHECVRNRFGLEEPDWAEIGGGVASDLANPGFIRYAEYWNALFLLAGDWTLNEPEHLRDAFLLLLCFRFGLRGSEGISLARCEWVQVAGSVVVLVTGRYRKLKTRGSRRQVPLIGELDRLEQQVVEGWLAYWQTVSGGDESLPLFPGLNVKKPEEMRACRQRILDALRSATKSSRTNLHHARHSFANILGLKVLPLPQPGLWSKSDLRRAEPGHVRKLLMGPNSDCTRRHLWAIARLLGHTDRRTTAGSYLHVLNDWAGALVTRRKPDLFQLGDCRKALTITDLEFFPLIANYLAAQPQIPSQRYAPRTAKAVIAYMRMRASGLVAGAAAQQLRLAPRDADLIEQGLIEVGARLMGHTVHQELSMSERLAAPMELLGKISPSRWEHLSELLVEVRAPGPERPLTWLVGEMPAKRQLLLWRREHFCQLASFLSRAGWGADSVFLYRSANLDPKLLKLVYEYGLEFHLRPTTGEGGKKALQIERVEVYEPSGGLGTYADRLAVVRGTVNHAVADNYELIAIWLADTALHYVPPQLS